MTADDRQGVQCTICHRLVDPFAAPENPPEDAAILAALASAGAELRARDDGASTRSIAGAVRSTSSPISAPIRTRRTRETLISPFHRELRSLRHLPQRAQPAVHARTASRASTS